MASNAYTTKTRANFSIDKKMEKEFSELAQRLAVNKSGLIELYIQQWIKENKQRKTP